MISLVQIIQRILIAQRSLHTCSHKAVVCCCLCSPDTAAEADYGRENKNWASPEACLDRDPGTLLVEF